MTTRMIERKYMKAYECWGTCTDTRGTHIVTTHTHTHSHHHTHTHTRPQGASAGVSPACMIHPIIGLYNPNIHTNHDRQSTKWWTNLCNEGDHRLSASYFVLWLKTTEYLIKRKKVDVCWVIFYIHTHTLTHSYTSTQTTNIHTHAYKPSVILKRINIKMILNPIRAIDSKPNKKYRNEK